MPSHSLKRKGVGGSNPQKFPRSPVYRKQFRNCFLNDIELIGWAYWLFRVDESMVPFI